MGVYAGPDIVNNNLVFHMDAKNITRSWLGEPTVNLVVSPKSVTTGYATAAGVVTVDNQILNFDKTFTAGSITNTGWIAYTSASTVNNVQYTTSWYVKAGSTTSCYFSWGGAHQGNKTNFTVNLLTGAVTGLTLASGENYGVNILEDGWLRVWYSSTLTTGNAYYPQLYQGNGTMFVGALQIEQKAYPTRFLIGSRSINQAMIDISGSNKNIEMTSIPYASDDTFSFNGTNSYITLANQSIPIYNSSYTLEAWIKREVLNFSHGIIGDLQYDYQAFYVSSGNKLVSFHRRNDSLSNSISSTSSISTNWTQVVVVFDITTGKSLYINGILDAANANITEFGLSGTTYPNRGPKYIGRSDQLNFGGATRYFNGKIDVFKGYNRALTAAEIKQNFEAYRGRYGI